MVDLSRAKLGGFQGVFYVPSHGWTGFTQEKIPVVSSQCRALRLPRKGAAQGTPLPQQRWGSQQGAGVAMSPAGKDITPRLGDPLHPLGHVVVLLLSFPATPSRLHSCSLTQGLQILPTPARPHGRAQPLLLAEQVGRTRSVKVTKVFGIRERGREESGYHHGRPGATVDGFCRAPCSCERKPLQ